MRLKDPDKAFKVLEPEEMCLKDRAKVVKMRSIAYEGIARRMRAHWSGLWHGCLGGWLALGMAWLVWLERLRWSQERPTGLWQIAKKHLQAESIRLVKASQRAVRNASRLLRFVNASRRALHWRAKNNSQTTVFKLHRPNCFVLRRPFPKGLYVWLHALACMVELGGD